MNNEEQEITFKKDKYLIVKCPICKENDWRSYGGTEYQCNSCKHKIDIKRKEGYERPS